MVPIWFYLSISLGIIFHFGILWVDFRIPVDRCHGCYWRRTSVSLAQLPFTQQSGRFPSSTAANEFYSIYVPPLTHVRPEGERERERENAAASFISTVVFHCCLHMRLGLCECIYYTIKVGDLPSLPSQLVSTRTQWNIGDGSRRAHTTYITIFPYYTKMSPIGAGTVSL